MRNISFIVKEEAFETFKKEASSLKVRITICLCFAIFLFVFPVSAQLVSNGGSSDWNSSVAWSPNGIPGASMDVIVNHSLTSLSAISVGQNGSITINAGAVLTVNGGG